MTSARDLIAQTVTLAGGVMTGRVRLQKVMYLLSRNGLQGGFTFSYHHYGPFSRSVDDAVSDAKAFCGLREETGRRVADGASFSIFRLDRPDSNLPESFLGGIAVRKAKADIAMMVAVPSTVIEIAATIYWLRHDEKIDDWESELRIRKGVKAASGRTDLALKLLSEIGMSS